MPDYSKQNVININKRQEMIKAFPCFTSLTVEQSKDLAALFSEVKYLPQEKIVTENDLVDSIYIIVFGTAEVTHKMQSRIKIKAKEVPIAVLSAGESIGLNDTGFYSVTGKRTATVVAITDMLLLKLDVNELYGFLKKYNLELSMYAASTQMLRMRLIKQSLPFSKLSHERLQWLADRVEELSIKAGTILFNQNDEGDKCYLIRSGHIEIIVKDEAGIERNVATLKPPVLFGEATLITHTPRNATARAMDDCELLVLSHKYLSELIEAEDLVAHMFMSLMIDRSRPQQNPNVSIHQQVTADGHEITILKNSERNSYFKLSQEGYFIWQLLDGKHTLQEITLELAERHGVFAPDVVAALISKLTQSGFINNLTLNSDTNPNLPFWVRTVNKIRKVLVVRIAFGDANAWLTKVYNNYICYFFTKPGQIILALLAIVGFMSFIIHTPYILLFFSIKHASLLLLFGLIPLSLISILLHELGHAFAVKAFGREVHYIGVGWYWFLPIAYTDTSDMWLSFRKPRMLVNLAGSYVDTIVAGISAILLFAFHNPYIQGMLWLFALYTYIGGFRKLSPLQEMDGYYVLMDWIEKPRLRQSAVVWLVKKFPNSLRHPSLFKENWPEVSYWIACLVFLVLVSIVTFIVQSFVLNIFDIPTSPFKILILPLLAVLFSCLSILVEIKNQVEE